MYRKAARYTILCEFAMTGTKLFRPKVIDCGCGDGRGFSYIDKLLKPQIIVGVDNDERKLIEINRRKKKVKSVMLVHKDILDLKHRAKFDVFFCCETLEHFRKKDNVKLVKIMLNAVKPGGKILISFPLHKRSIKNPEHQQLLTEDEILNHFGNCLLLGKAYHMTAPGHKKRNGDCTFMVGFEKVNRGAIDRL